jgi:alpha-galactosidase/6-phospho-beta-glucosidase family protein
MKATFVGGGAHRLLSILRAALDERRIFDGGEICLYDINFARAETMAKMIQITPEYIGANCKVYAGQSLESSIDGADIVGIILAPGTMETARLSDHVCWEHSFISSDNVSPTGALLGVKGGQIILNVARKMEQYCPTAWLVDFANPVAVFSGLVNNHTKVKALGVCAGFTNHQGDIARLLGMDDLLPIDDLHVAGVNHLSFLLNGSYKGQDIFKLINESIGRGWTMPKLGERWASCEESIANSVNKLLKVYQDLGVLIFSTEGDGMAHLFYDREVDRFMSEPEPLIGGEMEASLASARKGRAENDNWFASHLRSQLHATFWAEADRLQTVFGKVHDDIFVRILRGVSGAAPVQIVSSRPNEGAVSGFENRTVLEYSQELYKDQINAVGELSVPPVVGGMISGLAIHQTLLGDAIAADDPRLLAHALISYPWKPYSAASRAMFREMIEVNSPDISPALRSAVDFL